MNKLSNRTHIHFAPFQLGPFRHNSEQVENVLNVLYGLAYLPNVLRLLASLAALRKNRRKLLVMGDRPGKNGRKKRASRARKRKHPGDQYTICKKKVVRATQKKVLYP